MWVSYMRFWLVLFILIASNIYADQEMVVQPEDNSLGASRSDKDYLANVLKNFGLGQKKIEQANSKLPTISYGSPFEARIAIVDIESIFSKSIAIKEIREKMAEISDAIQVDMSKIELDLKQVESDLVKQSGVIPEEEFNKKLLDFNHRVSAVQQLSQKRKNSVEKAHDEAIYTVNKNIMDIIAELAQKHRFNLVFAANQVIYAESNLDITEDVVSLLNKRLTEIEINYDAE